jgi:hypothetical protein
MDQGAIEGAMDGASGGSGRVEGAMDVASDGLQCNMKSDGWCKRWTREQYDERWVLQAIDQGAKKE